MVRRGAGIFVYDCSPLISNNTIVENRCTDSTSVGGGIYSNQDGSYSGVNNIIYFNEAANASQCAGNADFTYSCSSQFLAGIGNITDDPLFLNPANKDFHLQAESPCIDAGDPNSPLDPDSTRADMGALYFDQSVAPSVSIALDPLNPPIQIPGSGGSFDYNITLTNNQIAPATCDAWIMTQLPDGAWFGPLLGPVNLTIGGGASLVRLRTQDVPANAPPGIYTYEGRVGVYPDSVRDSDSFTFEKLATGSEELIAGWSNHGIDFTEYRRVQDLHLPTKFEIIGIYPNPFNPTTTLYFTLHVAEVTTLKVFDVSGREVATLSDGWLEAGSHAVAFDGAGLASGVYIYMLQTETANITGKMLLLK